MVASSGVDVSLYLCIYLVDNCFEKDDNICMKYVACT